MQSEERSPWGIAGAGCVALVAASAVALIVFVFVGQRMARSVRAQAEDPALRSARVQEVLAGGELPEGYAPALSVSVPLLGRVTVIEREPVEQGVFLFLRGRSEPTGEWNDELDRLLAVRGITLEPGESVTGGEIEAGPVVLTYRVLRAGVGRGAGDDSPVLVALVEPRCTAPQPVALLGVWIEPDPAAAGPVSETMLAGTPADPQAVARFMSAFRLCP